MHKRESLIYTVLMCFTMVLWMSMYNVALHMGTLNMEVIREGWRGFPLAYVCAMCLYWFLVSKIAKGFAFRFLVKPESSTMKKVIAVSEVALSCYNEDGIRLVRSRETGIGDFCADAYRAVGKADIAFVNGGGIRANIPAGEITYADLFAVHPFGNDLCVVKATGQEILDCLEMCYRILILGNL